MEMLRVFCSEEGQGGSLIAVVWNDPQLTEGQMLEIANASLSSHTVFIAPNGVVRYLTRDMELTNCGHGALAAAYALCTQGSAVRTLATRGGPISFEPLTRNGGFYAQIRQSSIQLTPPEKCDLTRILDTLGATNHDVCYDLPPVLASPGTPRLLVCFSNRERMLGLRPDFERLKKATMQCHLLGCFVYWIDSKRPSAQARMFAPAIGVNEDAVNGNSASCLGFYMSKLSGRSQDVEVKMGTAGVVLVKSDHDGVAFLGRVERA